VADEEEGCFACSGHLAADRSQYDSAVRVSLADPVSYTLPYDQSLAEALAGRGHDVELLCATFTHGSVAPANGYRRLEVYFSWSGKLLQRAPRSQTRLLLKGLEYVPSARRLQAAVRAFDPDVLHLQWLGIPQYDVRWLERVARDRAVVFTAHEVLPTRSASKVDVWRRVFRAVDRVVAHSERAVERLASLGVERERIVRIPHPLFVPPPGRAISPPRGATLLFFGLIRQSKGLDLLLRALPAIVDQVPEARLFVAGDPIEPVEPLRQLAAELGVADRIDWRLGYLADSAVADLMEEATVVCLPYRRIESSGVLAMALGHGRPAVVTDVGSLADVVGEFGAGLVVPPEDPAALAAACVSLLTDGDALDCAARGTEAARQALTWDASARAHERLYEEVKRGWSP
jgi:glycosyltransferase involved in cell wall biosynthesis